MVHRRIHWSLGIILSLAMGLGLSSPAGAQVQVQFQIVHSFGAAGDGIAPGNGMVMDSKGILYGVTASGGTYGYGTVYELTPGANGQWTETILHNFPDGDPSDGWKPIGLVIDESRNLYGTTQFGGDGKYCLGDGCGTVFELLPGANGEWTESILWNFCSLPNCADGVGSAFAPTLGPGGSLYGVEGTTVFQLMPGSGGWTLNALYTFCEDEDCPTGSNPSSGVTLDAKGNLYGETAIGGQCTGYPLGCGVAYALHQQSNGQWEEFILHEFQEESGEDGGNPHGGLTFHDGGLYGVTDEGGSNCVSIGGCGTIFELTRGSGQNANEQIVWSFGANEAQGFNPGYTWVVFDKQGNLFGVTGLGGLGDGLVYGMRQQTNGTWEYAVLHAFDGADGVDPNAGLLIDSKGNLYGTTGGGGEYGYGVAFELSPVEQAN